jgi:hypothetical protein
MEDDYGKDLKAVDRGLLSRHSHGNNEENRAQPADRRLHPISQISTLERQRGTYLINGGAF